MGTSLIDAHAGGVGVMESVPAADSKSEGNDKLLWFHVIIDCSIFTFSHEPSLII